MQTFDASRVAQVQNLLTRSKRCVIVAHKSPDGDSVGSSLGLLHFLKQKIEHVVVCHPDPAPHFLEWLPGASDIINGEENLEAIHEELDASDVIFCLDFNDFGRVGKLRKRLERNKSKTIMIDHHLDPKEGFKFSFSEPESCSTAQLIVDFMIALGEEQLLNAKIGTPLYCGIMTDTGSFRFSSVTPHTHRVIALLLEAGVIGNEVHERVFDTNTFDRLKLRGFTINEKLELLEDQKTVVMSLTTEELERFNYQKGDTEGLVNIGLSIQGVNRSIFLKESDGIIKISFRSKGSDNPVNVIANEYFSGGGHANAAGGKWEGPLEEAITKVKTVFSND